MMSQRIWTSILGTVVIAGAAVALVSPMLGKEGAARAQTNGSNADAAQPVDPVRVQVATPQRRALERRFTVPASLEPFEQAEMFAKVSGYVSTVSVDIGSRVRRGDLLVEIDVPEMQDDMRQARSILTAARARVAALKAQLAQVRARLATAEAEVHRREAQRELERITVARKQRLFEEQAIPQQDLDEAQSRLAVAEADVRIAQTNVEAAEAERAFVEAEIAVAEAQAAVEEARLARLETLAGYLSIRAPFDGVVTERRVDPGAFVRSAAEGSTEPLVTVSRVDRLRLVMYVPESDAPYVRVGSPVDVQWRVGNATGFTTKVTRTAAKLHTKTRTMRVEADIDNGDGRLMPGSYAKGSLLLETKAQAMMVPSQAIRVHGSNVFVLVAEGGTARAAPVTVGYDDGIWAEVPSGLTGGEQVIVTAASVVHPGSPVSVTSAGS